jgi:hypothetical protein
MSAAERWLEIMGDLRRNIEHLTEWEQGFVQGFRDGQLIAGRCTTKQVATIRRMHDKIARLGLILVDRAQAERLQADEDRDRKRSRAAQSRDGVYVNAFARNDDGTGWQSRGD